MCGVAMQITVQARRTCLGQIGTCLPVLVGLPVRYGIGLRLVVSIPSMYYTTLLK